MADNQNNNVEFTSNKDQHLKRSLKARHMNMIALGGAIGTGLFVAGGEVVSTAGPGGALVAYGLIGIIKRDDRAILNLELALESDIDLLLANGGFISDRSQLAIIID